MEIEKIRSKIQELASGNPDFPAQFAEMCIRDLEAFPKKAAEALQKRDLRQLSHAIHQMKTIIGLFDLKDFNALLSTPPQLFEASKSEKKEFITKVHKESRKIIAVIKKSVSNN